MRAGGDDVLGTLPRDDLEPAGARADAGRDGALALVETLLGELRREGVETDATGATGEGGGGGEDHDARRGVGRVGRAARGARRGRAAARRSLSGSRETTIDGRELSGYRCGLVIHRVESADSMVLTCSSYSRSAVAASCTASSDGVFGTKHKSLNRRAIFTCCSRVRSRFAW